MRHILYFLLPFAAVCCMAASCKGRTQSTKKKADTIAMARCPKFQTDSAMQYIVAQCDFGPRVPGTKAWEQCAEWIEGKFQAMGCETEVQATEVKIWDGTMVPCRNIIARINPQATDRILLCAHWDSRPWADNDADEKNHKKPVMGANDGASGVAVIMELARNIMQDSARITTGIDIVCFDVEDMGAPEWAEAYDVEDDWCLGSLHWASRAAQDGYRARFGILFDMVGGRGSTFAMEGISRHFADPIVQLLWNTAKQLGYSHFFPKKDGGYITDDHINVNRIAQIPTIDIIPYHEDGPSNFGPTWHTVNDTPENIDPNVLEAVGQSVLQLIYNENN